jgi:hypothetical protein
MPTPTAQAVANPTIAHRISCPVSAMFVLYFIHQQRESRRLAPANLNNWVAMPRESRPIRDAHLDRLHRTLGLRSGPVEHAVIPDDCNFGGDRLLFRDRTFLRLRVLNDPIGLRCGREDETEVPRATVGSGRARSSRATARRGSPCHRRSIQASCGFMRRKRSEGEPQPNAWPGTRCQGPAARVARGAGTGPNPI